MISFPGTPWASFIYQNYNGIKIILTKCKRSCFSKRAVSAFRSIVFADQCQSATFEKLIERFETYHKGESVCREHGKQNNGNFRQRDVTLQSSNSS